MQAGAAVVLSEGNSQLPGFDHGPRAGCGPGLVRRAARGGGAADDSGDDRCGDAIAAVDSIFAAGDQGKAQDERIVNRKQVTMNEAGMSPEEKMSALFAQLIMQQSNM